MDACNHFLVLISFYRFLKSEMSISRKAVEVLNSLQVYEASIKTLLEELHSSNERQQRLESAHLHDVDECTTLKSKYSNAEEEIMTLRQNICDLESRLSEVQVLHSSALKISYNASKLQNRMSEVSTEVTAVIISYCKRLCYKFPTLISVTCC